ncbi:HAD family phosphatase [Cyanobium sp. Morenito 9A2]|uniref:HAD family hydrolase n=1 Tax=Cyanobium sp. Morenito 9A2 TaxID=2823718 RepID=UPI0020CC9421|nr:HAD family phosphatase [Cyanobium sp. Morenito 9A2]MCP9849456.1 HAD family phosphatase [Cyanobium sp. Morenito 9A2]
MNRPAACLFDLDGLLLDTEPLHGRAWSQAAHHFGVELAADQLLSLRGRRRQDNAAQVLQWIQAQQGQAPTAEALFAVQQPIAQRLLPQARGIDGAAELLTRCQELSIPMALVTSSSAEAVAHKAAPHPWLALIGMHVHGDDPELERGKPAPDSFLLAAHRLGVPAADCWAFEDSPAGALAAREAGCQVHVLVAPDLDRSVFPTGVRLLRSLRAVELA